MADEKKGMGPEEPIVPESPDGRPVSELAAEQGVIPGMGDSPAPPGPGDVVVDFEKINELMAEKRAAARDTVEHEETPAPGAGTPADGPSVPEPPDKVAGTDDRELWEKTSAELEAEQKKTRRGRPPKAEKTEQSEPGTARPRKGRPAKADKAAHDGGPPPKRDKVSRSKKADPVKGEPPAPALEPPPEEPKAPPRPIDEGKTVYLKLSELHAFHTFRDHPFQVKDDDKMTELVGTIKEHGVMTPATVRPEKDGNGYEIIAGHRRCRGSELAGLEELPCIVRNMTDFEAVREMRNSNKQRGEPLPSELAKLLDLEVEAIKHQGGRMEGVAAGDVGKRSVEIVGADHGMNYKKVMRYIRLNSLVPELLNMHMQEALKVKRLSKSYGNLLAVDSLNLCVRQNTVFGLLGANGAGKSTTIECILGTRKADIGGVSVLGRDPKKDRRDLFQEVGVQFQEGDYQPEIKVSELCEETACLYKSPADWKSLCEQFGIGDKVNRAVKSPSGGERQRLFIVLALIPDPQLVFLDELTTGLDAKARRDVWKILEGLKSKGLTIFLTSHFMDEVEALCDEICILKNGRAVFYGTVAQAKEQCGCEKFEDAYLVLSGEEGTDE